MLNGTFAFLAHHLILCWYLLHSIGIYCMHLFVGTDDVVYSVTVLCLFVGADNVVYSVTVLMCLFVGANNVVYSVTVLVFICRC